MNAPLNLQLACFYGRVQKKSNFPERTSCWLLTVVVVVVVLLLLLLPVLSTRKAEAVLHQC